jgi:glycosyltransferase involved in cell wall biosynthesis
MLEKRSLSTLFVHTDAIKERLIRRFGWQEQYASRIGVVPDPLELSYGHYSQEAARERLQLPQNVPILLFFGELRRNKGPDILLDAVKNLEQDFRLVIAGLPDDTARLDIASCKEQLDKPDKIIARLNYIPEGEVDCYFLSADVVVLPYRKDVKGTSGILQHACAAGKPVIASDVGEIGRMVKEHSLGIIVEPESPQALRDGIQSFLADREAITALTAPKCLQYASENTWNKMASLVESAYQSQRQVAASRGNA